MAKILYAWEWGAGLGHLARFAPIAEHLTLQGHEVVVVTRSTKQVARFFPTSRVDVRQAPLSDSERHATIAHPRTFASLSWNLGYHDRQSVLRNVTRWTELVRTESPDLVISDFGIGAAIAAVALDLRHIRIGTGYACPPALTPMPQLRLAGFRTSVDEEKIELTIVGWIKESLGRIGMGEAGIESFSDVVGRQNLLATLPQFDHYERSANDSSFLGIWDRGDGRAPKWNSTDRPKVFAYLKPHRNVAALINEIVRQGFQVLVASDVAALKRLIPRHPNVMFVENELVDLRSIAECCAFAVTNANHGTTVRILAYGLPVLACPIFIEQEVTSQRIATLNLGRQVTLQRPSFFAAAVSQMSDPTIRKSVSEFSRSTTPYLDRPALRQALQKLQLLLDE